MNLGPREPPTAASSFPGDSCLQVPRLRRRLREQLPVISWDTHKCKALGNGKGPGRF